jgi:hypothetical protein
MKGREMYIRCKPYETEQKIREIRQLAIGGDLKPTKVLMGKISWEDLVGDGRLNDMHSLSGVPVEFSDITGKDAFVMLGPVNEASPDLAPQKPDKSKGKSKK